MNLSGIIAISGRPGLFKVIAQGKNNVIVESLVDRKRFPAYSSDRISALDDISIYTYEEEKPLKEIFKAIYEKESGAEAISHKDSEDKLVNYLLMVLPNYDQERVYVSDIKKIFQWYNLLHKSGELKLKEEKKEEVVTEASTVEKPKSGAKKASKSDITTEKVAVKKAKTTEPKPEKTKTTASKASKKASVEN